jgi:hypothetical protein
MSVTEAFAAVPRGCIGHIATAADSIRRSDDPEGIRAGPSQSWLAPTLLLSAGIE